MTASKGNVPNTPSSKGKTTRRDFLMLTTGAATAVGAGAALWPFINSMNPAKDVLAASVVDVDVSKVKEGQQLTVMWRGKPVFIRRRTAEDIKEAEKVPLAKMIDPQTDKERFGSHPEWLVVVGICTHLGCVPTARADMGVDHNENGWLCACHGSKYDTSGRVTRGPAPQNLEIPPFTYVKDKNLIKIG